MNPSSHSRGYTLLEVLVALTLASVLAAAAFTVFFNSQKATGRVTRVIENRQNSRTAIQLLERDLRMAGSGWGRVELDGCYNGAPLAVPAIQPWYGGSDMASDSIGIMGGWDQVTTLRSPMANTSSTISVVNTAGFSVNDFVVVTNAQSAHLFQITGITAPPYDIAHATTSPYNVSGGHVNWPAGGYKIGAKVYRATWVSYKVDTTSAKRQMLVRWEQSKAPQVVAYDISQFTVAYMLQDSSLTRNPDDITMIEQVHPVLSMKTAGAAVNTSIADSSWAMVKPRSY